MRLGDLSTTITFSDKMNILHFTFFFFALPLSPARSRPTPYGVRLSARHSRLEYKAGAEERPNKNVDGSLTRQEKFNQGDGANDTLRFVEQPSRAGSLNRSLDSGSRIGCGTIEIRPRLFRSPSHGVFAESLYRFPAKRTIFIDATGARSEQMSAHRVRLHMRLLPTASEPKFMQRLSLPLALAMRLCAADRRNQNSLARARILIDSPNGSHRKSQESPISCRRACSCVQLSPPGPHSGLGAWRAVFNLSRAMNDTSKSLWFPPSTSRSLSPCIECKWTVSEMP